MTFHSGGPAWEDLRVSIITTKVGGNAPTLAAFTDTLKAYSFVDNDEVHFSVQMPHSWMQGSLVYPHVHFATTSDVSPADNFKVGLEYSISNIGSDFPASTTVEETVSTGVNSDMNHQIANIGASGLDLSGYTLSSVMVCRLYRAAAAVDNYGDAIFFTDFDIHYRRNSAGSTGVLTK